MFRRVVVGFAVAYLALALASSGGHGQAPSTGTTPPASTAPANPSPASPPPTTGQPTMRPPTAAPIDSFVAERDSMMKEVLTKIAGRESAPAESVFKNIKIMKTVPAGQLLRVMNLGFGRSLGTNCGHCHVTGHWADEDKAPKQIARDMMMMTRTINDTLLARIKNLKSEKPGVACATCHRGQLKPARQL